VEEIWELIPFIIGLILIFFRKPISRSMVKSQLRIAKRMVKSAEFLKIGERVGYPLFEISAVIVGLFAIILSIPDVLQIIRDKF